MTNPTKADLTAAVERLTGENEGLRGLLAAISLVADTVPVSKGGDYLGEWKRSTKVLAVIKGAADLSDWDGYLAYATERVRETAAEPVGYEAYEPEPEAESAASETPLVAPYAGRLRLDDDDCWLPLADGACGDGVNEDGEGIACGVAAGHLRRHERGARPGMGGGTAHWPNPADPETGREPQPEFFARTGDAISDAFAAQAALSAPVTAGTPLVVTDDRCECGHPARVHNFVDVGTRGFCHECDAGTCKHYRDAGDVAVTA